MLSSCSLQEYSTLAEAPTVGKRAKEYQNHCCMGLLMSHTASQLLSQLKNLSYSEYLV